MVKSTIKTAVLKRAREGALVCAYKKGGLIRGMKAETVRVAALATFPRLINLSLTNKRMVKLFNKRSDFHHLNAINYPTGFFHALPTP